MSVVVFFFGGGGHNPSTFLFGHYLIDFWLFKFFGHYNRNLCQFWYGKRNMFMAQKKTCIIHSSDKCKNGRLLFCNFNICWKWKFCALESISCCRYEKQLKIMFFLTFVELYIYQTNTWGLDSLNFFFIVRLDSQEHSNVEHDKSLLNTILIINKGVRRHTISNIPFFELQTNLL